MTQHQNQSTTKRTKKKNWIDYNNKLIVYMRRTTRDNRKLRNHLQHRVWGLDRVPHHFSWYGIMNYGILVIFYISVCSVVRPTECVCMWWELSNSVTFLSMISNSILKDLKHTTQDSQHNVRFRTWSLHNSQHTPLLFWFSTSTSRSLCCYLQVCQEFIRLF